MPHLPPRRRSRASRDGERGQVLVLFTLAIVVILGAAALVVDIGLLRTDGARLQNALDAGSLAGAHYLPADKTNVAAITTKAVKLTTDNMPGVASPTVAYRCLIGYDATTGLPRTADMPSACNVSFAAASTQWSCTDKVCWAPCTPTATGSTSTDVCNTIELTDSATRQYAFGAAIGVPNGSTGSLKAAACNGLCGSPPTSPLDAVVIVDRTGSMSANMQQLRDGANAVLKAYNPAIQRVALGTLGPSSSVSSCGSPAMDVTALSIQTPAVVYRSTQAATNDTHSTAFANLGTAVTSTSTKSLALPIPSGIAAGDLLVATVSTTGTTIAAPAGWTLINTATTSGLTMAAYYRVATGSETSTYAFTLGATSVPGVGQIARYTGIDPTNPLDVVSADGIANNANGRAITAPTITTAIGSDRLIAFYAITGANNNIAVMGATGAVERFQLSTTSGPTLALDDYDDTTPGATGALVANGSSNGRWLAFSAAFRPEIRGATSLTITKPTSTAAGDVLVAGISYSGSPSMTPPTGWTLIRATQGTNFGMATYYKVATASEAASYTWTINATHRMAGSISRYTGVDPASVLDPVASSGTGGTANTGTDNASPYNAPATAFSTTATNSKVVGVFGHQGTTTWTAPTGMSERADTQFPANGPTIEYADVDLATATSTGTKTAVAAAAGEWIAHLFALRAERVDQYLTDPTDPAALAEWVPVGFSGTDTGSPAVTYNEAYAANGSVVTSSHLEQAVLCFDTSGTGTNLATPLDMATYYLQHYGRTGVRKGIIMETDGTPSSCPTELGTAMCNALYTDAAAQASADAAKAAGITLFTIGFGSVDPTLLGNMASTKVGTSTCTSAENLDGDSFFCTPTASELATIFQAAAASLAAGPHLVQMWAQPAVTGRTPTTGAAGTTVVISGKGFTDAYDVSFGGTSASFQVNSDTQITAKAPAHAAGVVDIVVSSPGGSSKTSTSDRYTYP